MSKNELKSQQRTNSESSKNKKIMENNSEALPCCYKREKKAEFLNKHKADILAWLFLNIRSTRQFVLDPSKEFFNQERGNAFQVHYSDFDRITRACTLVNIQDGENYSSTGDEEKEFSEK